MRILILFFILFSSIINVAAQHTIHGTVTSNANEKLQFASLYIPKLNLASGSDKNGKYIFNNIPAGAYTVECTFFGFEKLEKEILVGGDLVLDFEMEGELYNLNEVEITSNKNKITYFPGSGFIDKTTLQKENMGQDVPILLQWQPSVITTSDAGAGIGYTSLRIRGVDQARINVTVNDIPINDAESQNVFWVDMPDMASSTENVKIQRGVGPSTNGAGAYGGTVALNTFGVTINPSVEASINYGSFNTTKYNVKLNSGLLKNQYNIEARYSKINTDGYIDRATADLSSWYLEFSKVNAKTSIRLLAFEGKERTYQAWNGVPQAKVENDISQLSNHYNNNIGVLYKNATDSINLFNSGRTYNAYMYENQVDDYTQTHTQLHFAHSFNDKITAKTSLHYTRGLGYFEQYRYDDKVTNYGFPYLLVKGDTIKRGNIVRRRWLDNHFYGVVSKMEYKINDNQLLSIGGGYNEYDGNHYGRLVSLNSALDINTKNYYLNRADKSDGNVYMRHESILSKRLKYSVDLQYRYVDYTVNGSDNDLRQLDHKTTYNFFNPKVALNYSLSHQSQLNSSFAIANREPDRSDLLDNPRNTTPRSEKLLDYEFGYKLKMKNIDIETNLYFMNYKNQLVQTGELNDVGNALRINVPRSSRLGLELIFNAAISSKFNWQVNTTISKNKIEKFQEVLYDYTNGFEIIKNDYLDTEIAFSPSLVASNSLLYSFSSKINVGLSTKYISRQYLDNTSNIDRSIKGYTYTNLLVNYNSKLAAIKGLNINLQVNNLLNSLYSNNGYTYSYKFGGLITENFLFPQAGVNFIIGASIKL